MSMSAADLAARIRAKFPSDYDDVPDDELTARIVSKFPDYQSDLKAFRVSGSQKLTGLSTPFLRHYLNLYDQFEQAGITPIIKSGVRTAEQQHYLHTHGAPTKGNDGYTNISPHQEGRAIDFAFAPQHKSRGQQILAQYARANGLHIPSDEPWHVAILKDAAEGSVAPAERDPATSPDWMVDPSKSNLRADYGANAERARRGLAPLPTVPAEPRTGARPDVKPAIGINDISWHFGMDEDELRSLPPEKQREVLARTTVAMRGDERKKSAGQVLTPSLRYINQNREALELQPKSLMSRSGLPSAEARSHAGSDTAKLMLEAAHAPLDVRTLIHAQVVKEKSPQMALGQPTDLSPIAAIENLIHDDPEGVEAETEKRYQAYLRSQTPEMNVRRQEFGRMSAGERAIFAPLDRFGGGVLKTFGGLTSLGGLTPNKLSEWSNTRGQMLEEASSLAPLNAQMAEIRRGLPEKVATTLADTGIGIAEIVLLKKATGLSLGRLMALETALKTSDEHLSERAPKVAESYAMGRILESHLSRPASAALFGVPTAGRSAAAYLQGNMSAEDAILQSALQAGIGFGLGGKPKSELPRVPAEPSIEQFRAAQTEYRDQLEKGKTNAVETGQVEQSRVPEYPGTQGVRKTTEAGGSNRAEQSGQVQENQITPPGEKHPVTGRKYSSTQVELPPEVAALQQAAAARIPDSDLAADGRETRGHVTLKYGVHAETPEDVQSLLAGEPPIVATVGKVSIFSATKDTPYDVVKMDIDSPDLHRLNAKIAKGTDVTDTFPTYKPHITLAYVKPGEGAKYAGQSNELTGQQVVFNNVTFSGRGGQEVAIPLTGERAEVGKPLAHPNPVIDGKPIVATTGDGRAVVPNSGNKGGISVVKHQPEPTEPASIEPPELSAEGVQQTPSTPREIIEAAGLKYLGEQQRVKGKPPLHMFNEPGGSTLALETVTPETVAAKVKAHYEKRAGLPVVPAEPVFGVDQPKVLAHIAGPSGAGKTELVNKLGESIKNVDLVDLDIFDEQAVKVLGWEAKPKNGYSDAMLNQLHDVRQSLIDDYIAKSDKPIIFFGHHIEGDNVTDLPAADHFLLNVSPTKAALNAARRPGKTSEQVKEDIQIGKRDVAQLKALGYEPLSSRAIFSKIKELAESAPEVDAGAVGENRVGAPSVLAQQSRQPSSPVATGAETEISVPDSSRAYPARYVVRELDDIIPSHNAETFQPRADYEHVNDRQYQSEPQYQVQVMERSRTGKFNPRAVLNNSPTVEVGPSVIDANGNVLGGNSRQMILERVYAQGNTKSQEAYRTMLMEQASLYGLDPQQIAQMKRPVLVRELTDANLTKPELQRAITELNRTSTTPLTADERATAAEASLSEDAAQFITRMVERGGDEATVRSVMDDSGAAIINRLIEDGVLQPGERNVLLRDGKATAEAKARIEKVLVSSVYRDIKQMDDTPDGVKRNIERIVAPLRRVAGSEWDMADKVQSAIDAIVEAKATTKGDLDMLAGQMSLTREPFTLDEIAIARALRLGPRRTAEKFRGYANDYTDARSGGGLFGAPTQSESLMVHFGVDSLIRPLIDPVADEVAKRVIAAADSGNLQNLAASIESAPSEARMQILGLTAEIAKEKASGQETAPIERSMEPGSEAGSKVPEGNQGLPTVPELAGSAGAEVANRLRELGASQETIDMITPEQAAEVLHKNRTTSWMVLNKETGEVVTELRGKSAVDKLNAAKYEAVPVEDYIANINKQVAEGATGTINYRKPASQVEVPAEPTGNFGPGAASAKEPFPEVKERSFGVRFTEDKRIAQDIRDNIGTAKYYEPVPNTVTAKEAQRLVDERGIPQSMNAVMDENNGIPFHVRSAMGQIVIKRLNQTYRGLKNAGELSDAELVLDQATDMAEWQMDYGTRLGQGVQSFAMWVRLSPEGKLLTFKRAVNKARQRHLALKGGEVQQILKGMEDAGIAEVKPEDVTPAVPAIRKALATRAVKAQRAAAKGDEDISIWQEYKDSIAKQLLTIASPKNAKPDPPLQEFADRLLANVEPLIRKPEMVREKPDLYGRLREVVENFDKYRDAWNEAIAHIRGKYDQKSVAELSEIERRITDLNSAFQTKAFDRVFADAVRQAEINFQDVARDHYLSRQRTRDSLIADIQKGLGIQLSPEDAADLASKIEQRMEAKVIIARQRILKGMEKTNKTAKKASSVTDKIVEAARIGVLNEQKFYDIASEKLGLPKYDQDVAAHILELAGHVEDTPEGIPQDRAILNLNKYIAEQKGFGAEDLPFGIYYGNILSGYNTHIVNALDTALNVISEVNGLAIQDPRAAAKVYGGMLRGFVDGRLDALMALSEGRMATDEKWMEAPRLMEIARFGEKGGVPIQGYGALGRAAKAVAESKPGTVLNAYKYVTRLLAASDAVMYRSAKEARASLLAYRMAKAEGLSGDALDIRVREILALDRDSDFTAQAIREGFTGREIQTRAVELRDMIRDKDIDSDAADFAGEATYNHEPHGVLGFVASTIGTLSQGKVKGREVAPLKLLKLFVPFTRIVANVTNRGLNWTPYGFKRALAGYSGNEPLSPEARRLMITRATLGTAGLALLGGMQHAGVLEIHGAGPSDSEKRRQLQAAGWRPYSIQVGDHFFSYVYTPMGLGLSMVGNITDAERYHELEQKDVLTRSAYAVARLGSTVFSQSFLSGLSRLFNALSESPQESVSAVKQTLSSTVSSLTTPAIAKDIYKLWDNKAYQSNTLMQDLIRNTPFAALALKPQLNAFGEPVRVQRQRFLDVMTSDPEWRFVVEKGLRVPVPSRTSEIEETDARGVKSKRRITPEEYYELLLKTGPRVKFWIGTNRDKLAGQTEQEAQDDLSKAAGDITADEMKNLRRNVKLEAYQKAAVPSVPAEPITVP